MFNPFSGRGLTAIGTLGASELLGEDTMSKIPVLNAIGGYKSDEEKNLERAQKQLAEDAKRRMEEQRRARMQALGQSMLAFAPYNQVMAQMFGPQAAFQPQQMAQMLEDPTLQARWGTGSDADRQQQVRDLQAQQQRQQQLMQNMPQPGPGPAPIQMSAPQKARRY